MESISQSLIYSFLNSLLSEISSAFPLLNQNPQGWHCGYSPWTFKSFISVFDPIGSVLLFEPPLLLFLSSPFSQLLFPSLSCGLLIILSSQSFCLQPTCTLLVIFSHSPSLSRTKVRSPRSWISTWDPNPGSTHSLLNHRRKTTQTLIVSFLIWEWTCQQGCRRI